MSYLMKLAKSITGDTSRASVLATTCFISMVVVGAVMAAVIVISALQDFLT